MAWDIQGGSRRPQTACSVGTIQITCRQVFFLVPENVSTILTLLNLPGTRERPLEIFPGELFEKNSF